MATTSMAAGAGSADNEDYKDLEMERKKQLPLHEDRCCHVGGIKRYRCKYLRMNHGASADDATIPKTKFCEKHYNYYTEYNNKKKKKKSSGDGVDAGSGPDLEMERKKQLPLHEERCCHSGGIKRYRCKYLRMNHGASADDATVPKTKFCEKHYNYYAEYNNKKKKTSSGDGVGAGSGPDLEMQRKKQQIPPYEERCSQTSGNGIFPLGAGSGPIDEETRGWKRTRIGKVTEEEDDLSLDVTSDIGGSSANVGTKKKNKEMEKKNLPPDEQRCCQYSPTWRCKNFRMGYGADDNSVNLKTKRCEKHYNYYAKYKFLKKNRSGDVITDAIAGGGSARIGAKRKKMETTSEELKSSTGVSEPGVESENLDHYKTECFQVSVELQFAKKELELAKIKLELQKKTTARDEDATEYWRNKCDDLETLVLALEIENLTMIKDSHVYASESEFPNYSDVSIPSRSAHLLHGSDNIEEGEHLGCLEDMPSHHGSSSQAHDEPEDSTGFVDSNISLGDPMDTRVMENSDRNKDEIDWKSFLGFPFSYTFGLD